LNCNLDFDFASFTTNSAKEIDVNDSEGLPMLYIPEPFSAIILRPEIQSSI